MTLHTVRSLAFGPLAERYVVCACGARIATGTSALARSFWVAHRDGVGLMDVWASLRFLVASKWPR